MVKTVTSKHFIFMAVILALFIVSVPGVHAQMMGNFGASPLAQDVQSEQQDEQAGKALVDKLNNRQITCQQLTDDNFSKIGDYYMVQSLGNDSARHTQVDQSMNEMMGQQANDQMHVALGKQRSGCETTVSNYPNMMRGGVPFMMGYGNMMYGNWGAFGIIASIFWIVGLVDLVLAGIWLWKQIQKK